MKILFVCWDSPDSFYLESLFLPTFGALRPDGYEVDVLQFSWASTDRQRALHSACEAVGAGYTHVRVRRSPAPFSPFLSAVAGASDVVRAIRASRADVVMPRSIMPSISVLLANKLIRKPIVFDADGLMADERVDFSGLSPTSPIYLMLRDVEAQMIRRSQAVLVRSREAVNIMQARGGAGTPADKMVVFNNGRDTAVFQPFDEESRRRSRGQLGVGEAPLIAYLGSLGGRKYLFEESLALFGAILERRPDARFLVLTGAQALAKAKLSEAGSAVANSTRVLTVVPAEVPKLLSAADLGLCLISSAFSMRTVSPIKLGEYLLCGVPAVVSRGVGDSALVADGDVAYLVDNRDPDDLGRAAHWFVESVLPRRETLRPLARRAGLEHYSRQRASEALRRALERTVAD